jgi:hypothetical protein
LYSYQAYKDKLIEIYNKLDNTYNG